MFIYRFEKAEIYANLIPQSSLIRIVKRQREISRIAVEVVHHRGLVLDGQALANGVGDAGRDAGG